MASHSPMYQADMHALCAIARGEASIGHRDTLAQLVSERADTLCELEWQMKYGDCEGAAGNISKRLIKLDSLIAAKRNGA